jgi:hypothetical protein
MRVLRSLGLTTSLLLALAGCGTTVPLSGGAQGGPGTGLSAPIGAEGPSLPGAGGPSGVGAPSGGTPTGTGTSPGTAGPSGNGATGARNSVGGRATDPVGSRVTTLLTIGVLAAGDPQAGAKTAGADSGNSVAAADTLKALIRHFQGTRLAGRPIRVVYREVPVTTTNYQTQLAADCAAFTQDTRVDVVISDIGYYSDTLTACLHRARVPQVEGGWGLTDDASFRMYDSYFTPAYPSYDFRFASVTAAGVTSGALKRGTRVGVVVEDCPYISRPYEAQMAPRLRAAGVSVETATVGCTTGFQSAGPIAQEMQQAAFSFRSKGVQTVLFATYPTGVNLTFFTQYASTQRYYPTYWLDSLAVAPVAVDAGQYPQDQYRNMRGAGWAGPMDVSSPSLTRPEQRRCFAVLRAQGVTLKRPADSTMALTACDAFFLVESALLANRGHSDPASLRRAIEGLGSRFAAGMLTGTTKLQAGRHFGPTQLALFGYVGSCGCFRYSTGPRSWT